MKPVPPCKSPELSDVPLEKWLGAKQVAAEFGVNEDTALRWWHEGLPTGKDIPEQFMRRRGFRDYLFHPAVIEFIRAEQGALA
jgi:hypothetical protein